MAVSEFPLPDVGEGLTEAEIVHWKVKPGDAVAVNQVLVEIETAKSLVELPSPFAGTVAELLVEEGATVEVGRPIIRVDSTAGSIELQAPGDEEAHGSITDATDPRPRHGAAPAAEAPDAAAASSEPGSGESSDEGGGAVLVGYGSKGGHASRRRRCRAPAARSNRPRNPPG